MHRLVALALCLLALPACSEGPSSPTPPFDVRLTVPLGSTLGIEGTRLGIRFDAVVEDSRCPANAMCIWEGRAIVRLTLRGGANEATVELHSNLPSRRAVTMDGVRIEWLQLEPYPYLGVEPPVDQYKVTVRVSR